MLALVLAIAHFPLPIAQQSAFVSRLGTDTISVETFERTADRLEGQVLVRYPRVLRRGYSMRIDASGRVTQLELRTMIPRPDTTDSVTVQRLDASRGVAPLVNDAWGPWELLTVHARRNPADSVRLFYWSAGQADSSAMDLIRAGSDTLLMRDPAQTHRARVDADGRVLSMIRPDQQFRVERVPVPYFAQLAAAWAAREQRDGRAGELSPRDSSRTSIGGATIDLNYSRPSRRGRAIFGRAVPWNQVWRTGANAATRLTTDRPLQIGGVTLPAGAYSLFTIPGERGWQLIINADPAAGGSRNPALDLYRLDMRLARAPRAVEQLTIDVQPEEASGVLRIRWDMIEATLPFTVSR